MDSLYLYSSPYNSVIPFLFHLILFFSTNFLISFYFMLITYLSICNILLEDMYGHILFHQSSNVLILWSYYLSDFIDVTILSSCSVASGSRHWKNILWIRWYRGWKWYYHCMYPFLSEEIMPKLKFCSMLSILLLYFRLKGKWTSLQWKKLAFAIVSVFLMVHLQQSPQRSCPHRRRFVYFVIMYVCMCTLTYRDLQSLCMFDIYCNCIHIFLKKLFSAHKIAQLWLIG